MKSLLKFVFLLYFLILLIGCSGPTYGPTQDSNQKDLNAAIRAIQNQDLNDLRSIISRNNAILNDIEDSKGNTLLDVAVIEGKIEIVRYLVSAGASVNHRNSSNETPLIIAIKEGKLDLIAYFLSQGADVNLVSYSNETPLHKAVGKGEVEIVKLIVSHGADLNFKDNQKETPLFLPLNITTRISLNI
jgi:ankyrin repeat protein